MVGATHPVDAQQTLQADGPLQDSLRVGASFLHDPSANENPEPGPTAAIFAVENRGRSESDRSLVGYIGNGIIIGAVIGAVGGAVALRQSANSESMIPPALVVVTTTLAGGVVGGIGGAFVYLMASSSDKERSPQ